MEVLERERQRNKAGGSGGLSNASGGNPNEMTGGPGGMGKKSSSTSQLSAAGNLMWIGMRIYHNSKLGWTLVVFHANRFLPLLFQANEKTGLKIRQTWNAHDFVTNQMTFLKLLIETYLIISI